jgi:DNA-binding response OmpR family regulator
MNVPEHSSATRDHSRVLIVDDHDLVRQMLRLALETAGFEVAEADTRLEAQRRLAHTRPDALILNLQHAETDGLALLTCARARQDLNSMPIVFLAGRAADGLPWQAVQAGADWFALRPVSLIEFRKRLTHLVRHGRPRLKAIGGTPRRLRPRGLKLTG